MTLPKIDLVKTRASFVALQTEIASLREVVADMLRLALSQPEGMLREELIECVRCLESVADMMRLALVGKNGKKE